MPPRKINTREKNKEITYRPRSMNTSRAKEQNNKKILFNLSFHTNLPAVLTRSRDKQRARAFPVIKSLSSLAVIEQVFQC